MRPLAGITVIDAGTFVSAPFAGLMLADLGADVIKVEPPGGEAGRRVGPRHNGTGYLYAATNRNKQARYLDLKDPEALRAFEQLLEGADVLLTNWRPGIAERFGLTAESVPERYPSLVWVRVSGYGQDGPRRAFPAFDSILQAKGGGMAGGVHDPSLTRGYNADKVTAMFAAQSAITALFARKTTGRGGVVDVSMLDVMAYWNSPDLLSGPAAVDSPTSALLRQIDATRPVRTKDGWIVVAAVTFPQITACFTAIGHPEWLERLKDPESPAAMVETFFALLDTVIPDRTSAEWEEVFFAHDVAAASVLTPEEHFDDVQVAHNKTYRVADDPHFGRIRRVRHPALFDGAPVETDDLPVPPLE